MNNPLLQHAHLFANGKFSVEWPYKGSTTKILGFQKYVTKKDGFEHVLILADGDMPTAKHFTLVARPIEDMTDEERAKFKEIIEENKYSSNFNDWNDAAFRSRLYLLEIGVYPFDQNHFEDGTVIDNRYELSD